MAVDVSTEIVIEVPVADVARYAENPDHAPEWYENIKSIEWQSAPPLARGSRIAFVAHFLGKRLAYTYEVTVYEPGECLVMRTAQGPFPMETTYSWIPKGPNSTLMKLRNRGEPRGFSRVMAPFMARAMRRANEKDLRRLKALLEQSASDQ